MLPGSSVLLLMEEVIAPIDLDDIKIFQWSFVYLVNCCRILSVNFVKLQLNSMVTQLTEKKTSDNQN